MGSKKTIKLIEKILRDDNKKRLYSPEELQYFNLQLLSMRLSRTRRKLKNKQEKGFGYL